jgi:hypothetical protein
LAYAFRRSIRPSLGQDEEDDSEDKQDSETALDDGCSPMSGLNKRLAANKAYRQRLAECEEEPTYHSHTTESLRQSEAEADPLCDENSGVGQGTPSGTLIIRQDSSLMGSGSGQVSEGQVTARLQMVAGDTACSAPATSPQAGGAADRSRDLEGNESKENVASGNVACEPTDLQEKVEVRGHLKA